MPDFHHHHHHHTPSTRTMHIESLSLEPMDMAEEDDDAVAGAAPVAAAGAAANAGAAGSSSSAAAASGGATASAAVVLDLGTAKDAQHLRYELEQHRRGFVSTLLGSSPADGRGLQALLGRWGMLVQFRDRRLEAQFELWAAVSNSRMHQASQYLMLLAILNILLRQATSNDTTTPGVVAVFALIFLAWAIATGISYRPPACLSPNACLHLLAVLDTLICGGLIGSSISCSSDFHMHVLCAAVQRGYSSTHMVVMFAMLLVHSIGLTMQSPWIFLHVGTVYLGWSAAMIVYSPDAQLVTMFMVTFCALIILIAMKTSDRHFHARFQYYLVSGLSQQLSLNRKTLRELDAAHAIALDTRTRAVRASAIHDIHDAIMGYTCHQLRNPLHAVQGFLAQLRERCTIGHAIDGADEDTITLISQSATQLAKVADDVLDYNRLQTGELVQRPSVVQVSQIVENALIGCSISPTAPTVGVQIADDVPSTVYVDGARVSQLLSVGISNGLKFRTTVAPLQLKVFRCADACSVAAPSSAEVLQFEVWNEGEGLGSLDVRALFSPYERSIEQGVPIGGLGLGLPISRLLVAMMGGDVGLEDRGRFTVFWFRLPFNLSPCPAACTHSTCSTPAARQIARPSLVPTTSNVSTGLAESRGSIERTPLDDSVSYHGERLSAQHPWLHWGRCMSSAPKPSLSVCVVDDLRTNRKLLANMLRKLGHEPTELEDGDQILENLSSASNFDVCLMDIHMVRTDGRQVTKTMRDLGISIPVIAVTGNMSDSDVESYRAAGLDGILGKPFNMQHLHDLLASLTTDADTEAV